MPQRRSLIEAPPKSDGTLPTEGGVSNLGDDIMRSLAVLFGIEEQKPGDAAGAVGALGSLLPLGKLLKFPPKFPNPEMSAKFSNEFKLMEKVPTQEPLDHEEIRKMLDLLDGKPKK